MTDNDWMQVANRQEWEPAYPADPQVAHDGGDHYYCADAGIDHAEPEPEIEL